MKRKLLFLWLVAGSSSSSAQVLTDTIYYNSDWVMTQYRDNAMYYRILENDGSSIKVWDFYKASHRLQMKGTYISLNPDIAHGLFTYYDEQGKLQSEIHFQSGQKHGECVYYHPNGKLETRGAFFTNHREGKWTWYDSIGLLRASEFYVKGVLNDTLSHYSEKGNLLYTHIYRDGEIIHTPSYEDNIQTGLALRGKTAVFCIIEDDWVFNITAGLEYRFAENHAVGIDYYFFRWRGEQEQYPDPTNTDHYVEFSTYNPRNSILVDYRYYFDADFSRKRSVKPYFQVYGRFGNARVYHDAEYEIDSAGIFKQREKFYDVGATFGIHYGFLPKGQFGFDVCAGAFYRTLTEDIEYYDPSGPNWFANDITRNKWMAILRVNLFYYVWSKKTRATILK